MPTKNMFSFNQGRFFRGEVKTMIIILPYVMFDSGFRCVNFLKPNNEPDRVTNVSLNSSMQMMLRS